MKRLWCCFIVILSFSPVIAQNDSLNLPLQEVLPPRDTAPPIVKADAKQQQVYKLKPAADIPIVAIGTGWSLYAFSKIYSKDPPGEEAILALNKNNINGFDRGGVRPYSETIDKNSYYLFYVSMPLPFVFLTGKETRKDFFKLSLLYLEAMSVTGFLYTGSVYLFDRYRPYAYSSETNMDQRNRGGAKNSFFAGHVALVSTSTFFMAKVYDDYHPDSKIKWLFYSLAGAATGITGYLRLKGGLHFPSDVIIGTLQGTLTGLLVPHFHKNRSAKEKQLSIFPFGNGTSLGLSLVYRLQKK